MTVEISGGSGYPRREVNWTRGEFQLDEAMLCTHPTRIRCDQARCIADEFADDEDHDWSAVCQDSRIP